MQRCARRREALDGCNKYIVRQKPALSLVTSHWYSSLVAGRSRLVSTINRQESLSVNTRIFTIESIVIVKCWRLLTTSYEPVNCQSTIQDHCRGHFQGQNVRIATFNESEWFCRWKPSKLMALGAVLSFYPAISSNLSAFGN